MNASTGRRRAVTALGIGTALAVAAALGSAAVANAAPTDLAHGKATAESGHNDVYGSANITDGNQSTYWEGPNNAFPQWVQVDLGQTSNVQSLVLELPSGWGARNETIAVSGSSDGSSFSALKSAASYAFDGSSNTVAVDVPDTDARYVRLTFTANSGWPAAQLSELQVLGTASGSGTPTDPPTSTPPSGTVELAGGQKISASSVEQNFVAANANDGSTSTYWEGAGGQYPSTLSATLRVTASSLSSVVLKLNPDSSWGARTQTLSVLGRASGSTSFTTLKSSASYSFSPGSGNTVTIPVSGSNIAEVRLQFTANTGAGNGQVAEFQVYGTASPTPDLAVSNVAVSPSSPTESSALTLSAKVTNSGSAASPTSSLKFSLGGTAVGTASIGALAAGASATISQSVAAQPAGSYSITAQADPSNTITELSESNNIATGSVTVAATPSADLVPITTANPSAPQAGQSVAFGVVLRNQGTQASSSASHGITLTITDSSGTVVKTLTGSVSGAIAAGASSASVTLGSWTAANGSYSVKTTVADDANEIAGKRANNTQTTSLFVGRGANAPWSELEAENGTAGGGATVVGPNRTVGDLAGEASGRKAVVLDGTGEYVQWTAPVASNTLVARFSIPDSSDGAGLNSSLNLYVNGAFVQAVPMTSRYSWLYGNETNPGNQPASGQQRHIYDETNVLLSTTIPAGATVKLQKDSANSAQYYAIDFVDLEKVAPIANPDPTHLVTPSGTDQQSVVNAINTAIQDSTKTGVYLPSGTYTMGYKTQVYGKALTITGAGPWYTRIVANPGSSNTDIGFSVQASATGSSFTHFGVFGDYITRIDGPGKAIDVNKATNLTVDDIWVEHMVCMLWAVNMDSSTVTNSRIRDTFADGINLTNGSAGNTVRNIEARSTGDDSFALFAATDNGGSGESGNLFENLTSRLTWRAAGIAVYGGQNNTFRNIRVSDTLVYSGITISSLDFGIAMEGFGPGPTTFDGITLERDGGHFYGSQTFPAIWVFSASKVFTAIRVKNVDIIDPTYSGIMFQTKYDGSTPENPVQDTTFDNVSISGARKSGDAYDAKSGFGIWVNEQPEPGQGPAVGSATFTNTRFSNNAQDVKNTTSTFTLTFK